MKIFGLLLVAFTLCGCGDSDPGMDSARERSGKTGHVLNLDQPYTAKDNLNAIYEAAVEDFAKYEAGREERSNSVVYRLSQKLDDIEVRQGDELEFLIVEPGQFCGVDRPTDLGTRLLNKNEEPLEDDVVIQNIGVYKVWISESRRRVQITLAWLQTISLSWTFLYEVDQNGNLEFVKGVAYGCSSPESWIDDPNDPMNSMGDQIVRTSRRSQPAPALSR